MTTYYKKRPKVSKPCAREGCKETATGNAGRKYCSPYCRLKAFLDRQEAKKAA